MKSALAVLQAGIADLRWYIETIGIEWELLSAATASPPCSPGDDLTAKLQKHIGKGIAKRRFDYNSLVISLYGLLEQYIESLVYSFAANLNAIIPSYLEMPDAVKKSHISLTLALVSKAEQSRYRGAVVPGTLIANLHSCLSNHTPYLLNAEVYCQHTANFRHEAVDDIFKSVGIAGISLRLQLFPSFSTYLAERFPERKPEALKPQEKFSYLNDLAERRNEVAHGNASEILSNELLGEYVTFIEAYACGLFELVYCHFCGHLAKHVAVAIGKPIEVFNQNIVCVTLNQVTVSVGDLLIAKTGNENVPYLAGEIEEVQVENVPHQIVPAEREVKVGLKVRFRCKRSQEFYLVNRGALKGAYAK